MARLQDTMSSVEKENKEQGRHEDYGDDIDLDVPVVIDDGKIDITEGEEDLPGKDESGEKDKKKQKTDNKRMMEILEVERYH